MNCPSFDQHVFSVNDISDDAFEYSGNFEVVASATGAVLVKKKYIAHCPKCKSDRYRLTKYQLEMLPHDNLPFGDA